MPELTENQAYAKAKELVAVYKVFSGIEDVFKASDEATRTLKHTKEQFAPVEAEMKKLQNKKALIEKDLVDIGTKHKAKKKQIDEAESKRKGIYQANMVKWEREIEGEKRKYNTLIANKTKEFDTLIRDKSRELDAKEKKLAAVEKEYREFVELAVGG